LPEGVILTDLRKGEWKVGKPIGSGGFGLIYLGELLTYSTLILFIVTVYCFSTSKHLSDPCFDNVGRTTDKASSP